MGKDTDMGKDDVPRLKMDDAARFAEGGAAGTEKREAAHESGSKVEPAPVPELHVCMGLNSCTGHGVGGTGWLAGMGDCATVFHVCHAANECRGQGGCGYSGFDTEQGHPGDQSCRQSGSCASPINVSRVHAAGVYRGTSVWKHARKIFEQRMYDAGIAFGPAPGEGYPDDRVPPYEEKRPS